MKLELRHLDSNSSGNLNRLILLAPQNWTPTGNFSKVHAESHTHTALLHAVQRFRGQVYLNDGAIGPSDFTPDGRHAQSIDTRSWHLVCINNASEVISCVRYYSHESPQFETTAAARSGLARLPEWRHKVRAAVDEVIFTARRRGIRVSELGGWCVASSARNTTQVLKTALSTWALSDILGGCLALTTATTRHCSSAILQRLGGERLKLQGERLPTYYDPAYKCDMELLHFDSTRRSDKYGAQVERFAALMRAEMPVLCPQGAPQTSESHPLPDLIGLIAKPPAVFTPIRELSLSCTA